MTTWNHRVIHKIQTGPQGSSVDYYEIHEVYYNEDGKPTSVTLEAVVPYGESPDELKDDFERMQEAFSKPILDYSDFDTK